MRLVSTGPTTEVPVTEGRLEPTKIETVTTPENVRIGSSFAKDLMLVRVITHAPDWAVQSPRGKTELILAGQTVTGKHSSGTLQFDIEPEDFKIFSMLKRNRAAVDYAIGAYTVVDAEDGYRLVSMYKRTELMAKLTELNQQREGYANWLNQNWESTILPLIRHEHEKHWGYLQAKLKQYGPPFNARLQIYFSLRPVGAMTPDDVTAEEWEQLSPQAREAVAAKMVEEGERLARERAAAIVRGAMDPVLDLALEVQGRKPNPKYDPTKPEGTNNRQFLPGIDSGTRRGGFIERLSQTFERIMNFRTFMTPEVIAQADAALKRVQGLGGDISLLNESAEMQKALTMEITRLGNLMQEARSQHARRERSVSL